MSKSFVDNLTSDQHAMLAPLMANRKSRPSGLHSMGRDWARRRRRRKELLESHLFDKAWYLERYPDVSRSTKNALRHFLDVGSFEGRSPGPTFDALGYLSRYTDVAASGIEPWIHFHRHGKSEKRDAAGVQQKADILSGLASTSSVSGEVALRVEELYARLGAVEARLNELLGQRPPIERLAQLEQVRAQWQASIPRILDRLGQLERLNSIEERLTRLENGSQKD